MSIRTCFSLLILTPIALASCGQSSDKPSTEATQPKKETTNTSRSPVKGNRARTPLKAAEVSQPIEFVRVKGGSFKMGGDSKDIMKPIVTVNVPTFEISKTEVTVGQYRVCVDAGRCGEMPWKYKRPGRKENHPMTKVSWHQAKMFAEFSGARLPTSAEWEFAATSRGTSGVYVWGNESPDCKRLNFNKCEQFEKRVCSYPTSNTAQGLCDMAGNLMEWVEDDWKVKYKDIPVDGTATILSPRAIKRVVRGGSYIDDAWQIEPRARRPVFAKQALSFLGFRLARSIGK